jgi:hypothetical protein
VITGGHARAEVGCKIDPPSRPAGLVINKIVSFVSFCHAYQSRGALEVAVILNASDKG